MHKCYKVMITGKVQDVGLRSLIEDIARLLDLKGFAFNDILGDIKKDTSALPGINAVLGTFVVEQKEHNLHMEEHNRRLEKILGKLAER